MFERLKKLLHDPVSFRTIGSADNHAGRARLASELGRKFNSKKLIAKDLAAEELLHSIVYPRGTRTHFGIGYNIFNKPVSAFVITDSTVPMELAYKSLLNGLTKKKSDGSPYMSMADFVNLIDLVRQSDPEAIKELNNEIFGDDMIPYEYIRNLYRGFIK